MLGWVEVVVVVVGSRRGRAGGVLWERLWVGEGLAGLCVCVCTVSVRVLKKTNGELSRRDQSAASTVRKVDAGFTVKATLLRDTVTQARRHAAAAAAADKASVTTTAVGVGSGEWEGKWKVTGPTATSAATGTGCFRLLRSTALRTKGGEELYGDI